MRLARALSLLFLGAALLMCLVGAAVTARFALPRRAGTFVLSWYVLTLFMLFMGVIGYAARGITAPLPIAIAYPVAAIRST